MDKTTTLMLSLLRASLNNTQPDSIPQNEQEWTDVYWLARKHGVVTMLYDVIERLPSSSQPTGDIALSWPLSAERTRYHFHHQEQVLQSIAQKAQQQGLTLVLIKGMSLARFYPVPSSRACGDIDIYFPNNYQQGNQLLGSPDAPIDGKHSEVTVDGVVVENHLYFLDQHFLSQRRAERYIRHSLSQVSPEGYLPPMANMVYLLMHTVCHLTAKFKLPLRNIIDWGIFLRSNQSQLPPQECHKVMRHIGMVDAFNMLTLLAGEFVGTDLSLYIIGRLQQQDVKPMRQLILSKKYLDPVPAGLPFAQQIRARAQRRRQRRWLYRYLPSSGLERFFGIIVRQFKTTFHISD